MDLQLKGKNAIITGGSKGIGKSIALHLAEEGVNIAICARGKEAFGEAKKELLKKEVKVFTQTCEVGDTERFNLFLTAVKDEFGSVDILVNKDSALTMGNEYQDWGALVQIYLMAIDASSLGRLGTPDEITKVATFLVSPCVSWVIGTCLAIDSGAHKSNL